MLLLMGPEVSGILGQEALGQCDLLVVPDSHHLLPRGVGILVTVGVVQGEAIVLVKNGFLASTVSATSAVEGKAEVVVVGSLVCG